MLAAQDALITMASTTSTEQSGLFAHLLPAFKQATGIDVKVVAVGTGQAIDMAGAAMPTCCSCTTRAAEEKFVAEGLRLQRSPVMYNDFVLVGPKSDPAGVKGNDIVAALKKIAGSQRALRLARRQERHRRRRAALWTQSRHRRRRPAPPRAATRNAAAAWARR